LYFICSKLNGFEIAGEDQNFYPAKASIKNQKVIVYGDQVKIPVAVRYRWTDNASSANLYNKDLFLAVPFRTYSWPAITKDIKYHIAF